MQKKAGFAHRKTGYAMSNALQRTWIEAFPSLCNESQNPAFDGSSSRGTLKKKKIYIYIYIYIPAQLEGTITEQGNNTRE